MSDILLHLLPPIASSLLYAGLGIHFWKTRWHNKGPSTNGPTMQSWERVGILGAVVLQGIGLHDGLFGETGMRFSFSFALSLMLWLAVIIYWLESFRSRMDGLQPLVLPLAAVCALLPIAFPQVHVIGHATAWIFKVHFLTAMLAYGMFTLSAMHAVFMGIVEKTLHQKASIGLRFANLPPLLTMEALLFRMIAVAFSLLTVALVTGVMFSEEVFSKPVVLDHKTLFAFFAWGIFAALLIGRKAYGWRGRIALRWTLAGFLVLMLAYVGSRFVSEFILGRI